MGASSVPGEFSVIGGRYQPESTLGQGGMAVVYQVVDRGTGRRLALKRLLPSPESRSGLGKILFEREYHTLAQLAHPSIIEVYDYGVDETVPFYTMELLDGADLSQQQVSDIREICSVIRDIASSLSVVHSRHFIHRDVSRRNIRRTSSGRAKLLDFGAMAPMGRPKEIIGTPPCVAPEALHQQSLDGRADIYSLGAVAYWLLCGRYPYPARSFKELVDLFRTPPPAPRDFNPAVSESLSQLVMQMIAIDPVERPTSAAEVIERLTVLGDLEPEEQEGAARAYLTTPQLVGRTPLISEARGCLAPLLKGKGTALVVSGPPGSGRSRILDACVLEAKLLGATVIRADATDSTGGEYGVVRAIGSELLRAVPKKARRVAELRRNVLATVIEELRDEGTPVEQVDRRTLQIALRDWILAVARGERLFIAVDDFDRVDEPSAALVTALARSAERRGIAVAVSRNSLASRSLPEQILQQYGHELELTALSRSETVELVRSVFGDVRHVEAVAHRIDAVCRGNPRDIMQLVHHLVAQDEARYAGGSWLLPSNMTEAGLPESMTAALQARLMQLDEDARELASVLALDDPTAFAPEHYAALTAHGDAGRTFRALWSLVSANVLVAEGASHRFAQEAFQAWIAEQLDDEPRQEFHARLARAPRRREDTVVRLGHLLLGGHEQEAIEHLVSTLGTDTLDYTRSALELLERAIVAAEDLNLPVQTRMILQLRSAGISSQLPDYEVFQRRAPPMLARLVRDSGLSDYYESSDDLPQEERLQRALMQAHARHQATDEHERGFSPFESIQRLARLYGGYSGIAGSTSDVRVFEGLPSLMPFSNLSPAVTVIQRLLDGGEALERGRTPECRQAFVEVLERVAQPDAAGMEERYRNQIRYGLTYIVASIDAASGMPTALEFAQQLDTVPRFRINGWIAKKAYYRVQGDLSRAAECQQRIELLQLQDGPQPLQSASYRTELIACSLNEDLLGLKGLLPGIDAEAERFPGLTGLRHVMHARYHQLRGDLERALSELEPALRIARAGTHADWVFAVSAHVELLDLIGRSEEALEHAEQYLAVADAEGLSRAKWSLEHVAVKALLSLGRLDEARARCDALIDANVEEGVGGTVLALAQEARARIALAEGDNAGFQHWITAHAEHFAGSNNRTVRARHQRLLREVSGAAVDIELPGVPDTQLSSHRVVASTTVEQRLSELTHPSERARGALMILLESMQRRRGFLLGFRQGKFEPLAGIPDTDVPEGVVSALEMLAIAETKNTGVTATAGLTQTESPQHGVLAEFGFEPLMLIAQRDSDVVLVAAAAIERADGTETVVDVSLFRAISEALADFSDVDPVTCVA